MLRLAESAPDTRRTASSASMIPSSTSCAAIRNAAAGGALADPGLQHPQLAALDGELDVAQVAVVLLQLRHDPQQLVVASAVSSCSQVGQRHACCGCRPRRPRPARSAGSRRRRRCCAGRRVAGEAHAGAASPRRGCRTPSRTTFTAVPRSCGMRSWRRYSTRPVGVPRREHRARSPCRSCSRGSCGNSGPVCSRDDLLERRRPGPRRSSASRSRSLGDALARLGLVERVARTRSPVDVAARSCRTSGSAGGRSPRRTARCRTPAARPLNRLASLSPMLSTVSIVPGIENLAPDRSADQQRVVPGRRAAVLRLVLQQALAPWSTWTRKATRFFLHQAQVLPTGLGGNGEAGWYRKAELRHLGKVGALAAEQVLRILCRPR